MIDGCNPLQIFFKDRVPDSETDDDLHRDSGNHVGLERLSPADAGAGYPRNTAPSRWRLVFRRQLRPHGDGADDGLHYDYGSADYRDVPRLPDTSSTA